MLRCVYDSETPSTVPIDTSSLPQITTEDPTLDEVCENLFFDFIEHPFDCGLLIFCYQETPIIRECPPNQIFHIETLQWNNYLILLPIINWYSLIDVYQEIVRLVNFITRAPLYPPPHLQTLMEFVMVLFFILFLIQPTVALRFFAMKNYR